LLVVPPPPQRFFHSFGVVAIADERDRLEVPTAYTQEGVLSCHTYKYLHLSSCIFHDHPTFLSLYLISNRHTYISLRMFCEYVGAICHVAIIFTLSAVTLIQKSVFHFDFIKGTY
jgi:hypothetical protein